MDSYEHMVDIIIAILVIFLFPLLYFGQKQETLIQSVVTEETRAFVDDIRSKGYVSKEMYDAYLEELSLTDQLYEIEIEHRQCLHEPEYRFRNAQEIIDHQNSSYTGSNIYNYRSVSTQVPAVSDPVNTGHLNTETNESVLASAVSTPASPSHIHTEACYGGHRHLGEEGLYFTHTHMHTSSCIMFNQYVSMDYTCRMCGHEGNQGIYRSYWNTTLQEDVPIFYDTTLICTNCRSTSVIAGESYVSYGYSCGYNKDVDGDDYYDKTGITQEEHYVMTSPQNIKTRATYTSGCYSYHNAVFMPTEQRYGLPYYKRSDIREFFNKGISNYCAIPMVYEFGVGIQDYYADYRITYTARLVNGQVEFHYSGTNISSYYSPAFPSVIDFATAKSLITVGGFEWFVNQHSSLDIDTWNYDDEASQFYNTLVLCNHTNANTWVLTCGLPQSEHLNCSQKVVSIVPTHPNQMVYTNDPLITTVRATYEDGSTKVVACTTAFSTASPGQNKTATLVYSFTLSGSTYTKSCNITVNVILRSRTCSNGHTYNMREDGSDPGCPYCKAWLRTLEVVEPSTGSITIFKGTTLSENGVTLLATYFDGRKEYLYNGYVDNLDKQYIGSQSVTISYKGKYVYLTVITRRNLKLCPTCRRYYELYPDGSDPGCPYCLARTPIFTGNVLEYYDKRYTKDIVKELFEGSGTYNFTDRDYLLVTAKDKKGGWGKRLMSYIYGNHGDSLIQTIYGGYIREDGNYIRKK